MVENFDRRPRSVGSESQASPLKRSLVSYFLRFYVKQGLSNKRALYDAKSERLLAYVNVAWAETDAPVKEISANRTAHFASTRVCRP